MSALNAGTRFESYDGKASSANKSIIGRDLSGFLKYFDELLDGLLMVNVLNFLQLCI